jgi:hypothetical protein
MRSLKISQTEDKLGSVALILLGKEKIANLEERKDLENMSDPRDRIMTGTEDLMEEKK